MSLGYVCYPAHHNFYLAVSSRFGGNGHRGVGVLGDIFLLLLGRI